MSKIHLRQSRNAVSASALNDPYCSKPRADLIHCRNGLQSQNVRVLQAGLVQSPEAGKEAVSVAIQGNKSFKQFEKRQISELRAFVYANSKEAREAFRHFRKLLKQAQVACDGGNEKRAIRIGQRFRFSRCADGASSLDKRFL